MIPGILCENVVKLSLPVFEQHTKKIIGNSHMLLDLLFRRRDLPGATALLSWWPAALY